jgi:hypothetical protein
VSEIVVWPFLILPAGLLIAAITFPELLVVLAGRASGGTATAWNQLTTTGRLARLLVTVLGTALFLGPFWLFAWAVLR